MTFFYDGILTPASDILLFKFSFSDFIRLFADDFVEAFARMSYS